MAYGFSTNKIFDFEIINNGSGCKKCKGLIVSKEEGELRLKSLAKRFNRSKH
jgi:hypothetical protein